MKSRRLRRKPSESLHDYSKLEDRKVLASVALVGGIVYAQGDELANDIVTISTAPNLQDVTVVITQNGSTAASGTFSNLDFTQINVATFGGADIVRNFSAETTQMIGGEGNDQLYGGDGIDLIYGSNGNDTIYGGAGNDTVNGQGGDDTVVGDDGNDTVVGGDGSDVLTGAAGNDLLIGGPESDYLFGGDGIDTIFGSEGNDFIFGGLGDDDLNGQDGNDYMWGDEGDDRIAGNDGLDILMGETGDDLLLGFAGADRLYGGWGNDTLMGGDGNDFLAGVGFYPLENFSNFITNHSAHPDPTPLANEFNISFGGLGDDVYASYGPNYLVNSQTGIGAKTGNDTYWEEAGEGNDLIFKPNTNSNYQLNWSSSPVAGQIYVGNGYKNILVNSPSNLEGFTTFLPPYFPPT